MKKITSFLLLGGLLASLPMTVCAETSYGGSDWKVTFTSEKKMESSFKTSDLDDTIYGMQPGDNAIIELKLRNENNTTTDWYMTNEVLYSLEDRSANSATGGGAYTYRLIYTDKNGDETTLFDSDTVGGDELSGRREGLREATAALEDYFYLDTFKKGEGGKILLEVALDGETQGNDYQRTLADLQMNFAVELAPSPREETEDEIINRQTRVDGRRTTIVQTGDESRMTPFVVASSVSGVLLLALSMYGAVEKKREKKEGQ